MGSELRDSRKVATESGPEARHRDYNRKAAERLADNNSRAHSTGLNNMTGLKTQTACSKKV